jgi:hypothetical protein
MHSVQLQKKENCVSIVVKVVWIGQIFVAPFAGFPSLDAQWVRHFIQPGAYSVERSEVADGCHRSIPKKLINSKYISGVVYAPVH